MDTVMTNLGKCLAWFLIKICGMTKQDAIDIINKYGKCELCGEDVVDVDDKLCHSCYHSSCDDGECYCDKGKTSASASK